MVGCASWEPDDELFEEILCAFGHDKCIDMQFAKVFAMR